MHIYKYFYNFMILIGHYYYAMGVLAVNSTTGGACNHTMDLLLKELQALYIIHAYITLLLIKQKYGLFVCM